MRQMCWEKGSSKIARLHIDYIQQEDHEILCTSEELRLVPCYMAQNIKIQKLTFFSGGAHPAVMSEIA